MDEREIDGRAGERYRRDMLAIGLIVIGSGVLFVAAYLAWAGVR